MAGDDKKQLLIIGGIILAVGLSICCITGIAVAFMLATRDVGPSDPPAGFVSYEQLIDCTPHNSSLVLTGFSLYYPSTHAVELCSEQTPTAFNYVTFYAADATGDLTGQFGVGYMSGMPIPELIDQLVGNLGAQMPAGSAFVPQSDAPLLVRDEVLMRKDYALTVTAQLGLMAPATYAFRVVLLPDEDAFGQGLTLILIKRADAGLPAAFAAMDADYGPGIESVRF